MYVERLVRSGLLLEMPPLDAIVNPLKSVLRGCRGLLATYQCYTFSPLIRKEARQISPQIP